MAGLLDELKRRNVVRVGLAYVIVGWVTVQIAQLLFEAFGTPDWVIKTVIVLVAIGFPFVLLFAWAFELTPDGLKKTREVNVGQSITASTGRKIDFIIIAGLVIALAYLIWDRGQLEPPNPVADNVQSIEETMAGSTDDSTNADEVVATVRKSIAVLPFVNMSADAEQEYFSDGLTEEILNSLARTPDLLVAARTSSFGFKGSTDPIPDIAEALGVDHVLEGSVRRGGDILRITAQLIRASDGFHLWSETYDRTPEDIIAIQEEIAINIAEALETALDPEALRDMMEAGTASVPAYNEFLTGIGAWQAAGLSGDRYEQLQVVEHLNKAIELDPEFSDALSGLSFFWSIQGQINQVTAGITDLSREEILAHRDDLLQRAIDSEDDDVTLLNLEAQKAEYAHDYRRSVRLLTEYVELRPNDDFAFFNLVTANRTLGRHQEIVRLVQQGLEEREFTRNAANNLTQALRSADANELIRTVAHDAADKFGNDVSLMYQVHRSMLWSGDLDGAALLLANIANSQLPEDTRLLAELRQACAELDLDTARQKYDAIIAIEEGQDWLAAQIMGDTQTANAWMTGLDQAGDFETIANFLYYPHLDTTLLPNFSARYANQRFDQRELIEIPYRCNR